VNTIRQLIFYWVFAVDSKIYRYYHERILFHSIWK